MYEGEAKINCLKFQKQEQIIKDIADKINRVRGPALKAIFAEDLQKEINRLFSCQEYDTEKLDCKTCHFIADLRLKTTGLIIKSKKLG